ncbi:MAG: NlpC/P60 family protein [Rickettsiales bacterium]|nr:NlpC/P60 family protein [Rickettsiales bacterium]
MFTRQEIVEQARTWVGTKFRYQGRIKQNQNNKGGVDCLGFIIGLCNEIGYKQNNNSISYYDTIIYSKKPDYNILWEKFAEIFYLKDIKNIDIGDIVLKKISNNQYHLMLYTGKTLIHASAATRTVVEHSVDGLHNCIIYSMFP